MRGSLTCDDMRIIRSASLSSEKTSWTPFWLAKITERGSLPGSFVPPAEIRALRTHTRYRRHLTQARTAEKQRVEKLLEERT